MPYVPPSELKDIPRKDRGKLQKLLYERAVMSCIFSWAKIHAALKKLGVPEEDIPATVQGMVAAYSDSEAKPLKSAINDSVSAIYSENGVTTLRDADPFGRTMDYIYMESKGTPVINRMKAIELAPKYNITPGTMMDLLEEATTRTPFVTLQARAVKNGGGEEEK